MLKKGDVVKYGVIGLILVVLIGFLFLFGWKPTGFAVYTGSGEVVERGVYWDKIDIGGGNYNLRVYNAPTNYFNGSAYTPITYGSCGSYCFKDWNGLIYRVSPDSQKAYIELYDVDDNLISRFGFGITGEVAGSNYKYTTLNFTWTWSQQIIGNEYIFKAYNNNPNFNWIQEYHFYPNQSMKIKNTITNNLANINNAKFWYIQTVDEEDGIWFNGTKHVSDTYKSGEFDNLLPQIRFEDYYVFEYEDLLENGFNITDFYLGDGGIIGVSGIRILAVGVTKGNSVFPSGTSVTVDPTVKLSGEGADAYVRADKLNDNYGLDTKLLVQVSSERRSYLTFNISSIPDDQEIDNASLCLYLYKDEGSQTISSYHVYESWQENTIIWNNQPCGTDFDNASACNLTAESNLTNDGNQDGSWQCWSIKNMVSKEYSQNSEKVSMVLHTTDTGNADEFYSKEYSNTSLWPYLEVGYYLANSAPSISIALPQEGSTYGYNESIALNFSVSDVDDNLDSCWYNINDGANISLVGCANISFDVSGDGSYTLNIYANDSLGLTANDSASFSVQVGAPSITLHTPINVYLSYQENIYFNYTPTDIDLQTCELWGDFTGVFELNQTDSSPTSGSENTFSLTLEDRTYLWNIKCNDSSGNSAFNGNKTFYVDTIFPSLLLTEPTGAKTSRTITASWSVSDASPVNCLYNVYQGASAEIANTSVICSNNSASFDVSSDASFIFNFYVNDSAGNSNSSSLSFSVDTSVSPPPSGDTGGGGGGGGSILSNATKLGKLQVSKIGSIISREGEKKTLSLNVKNTGRVFLNNCRLVVIGDIGSWIYSTTVQGIAPGENIDFVFDLNVPEETQSGNYQGKLEIKCDEGNNIQDIVISIPSLEIINIKDIKQEGRILKITYDFDNSNVVGDSASVDIWLEDSDGYEITRFQDTFPINTKGPIERNIEMELGNVAGIYYVYLALSDDLDNFIKKSVVLGDTRVIGQIVLDTFTGKFIIYIIFIILVAVIVYFIWRRHGKADNKKHHWLVREKKKQSIT